MKWTLPFFNLDMSIVANRASNPKSKAEKHLVLIQMRQLIDGSSLFAVIGFGLLG